MVYVKLKPKWLNGQLRYGICLLSGSVVENSGNLMVHYNNQDYATYHFRSKKWTDHVFSPLNRREREILVWSHQGLRSRAIADKLFISEKTVDNIKQILFQKLGLHSIEQTIQYAVNRRLLYHTQRVKAKKSLKPPLVLSTPKRRNRLSTNDIDIIQAELNKGKAVNAIAKAKGYPESTIRGLINQGKLTRNPKENSR